LRNFYISLILILVGSPAFALEKGKSSRETKVLYETKDFLSPTEVAQKKLTRFTVEQIYNFKLNKKNKLSFKIPWSKGTLRTTKNGVVTDSEVEGAKDIAITHQMTTERPKIGRTGVQWNFKINLPNGTEQLTKEENRVTSALGETGQGFSSPTYGKGLNLGFSLNLTRQQTKRAKTDYTVGYELQGDYSSLLDQVSKKKPGDTALFKIKRSIKKNKNLNLTYGLGTSLTRRTVNFRPGNVVSENPSRLEFSAEFKMNKVHGKKLKETLSLKFQERGEIEVQESSGQIVKTEQGDRATVSWTFQRQRNKRVKTKYGLTGIFGGANSNLEVVAPVVGLPTATVGKDRRTRMEEVQLIYGQTWTINKFRKWFLEGSVGLTDDSRDFTLTSGFNFQY
jgi:hypothetical protein